jgi:hypothetical protein
MKSKRYSDGFSAAEGGEEFVEFEAVIRPRIDIGVAFGADAGQKPGYESQILW